AEHRTFCICVKGAAVAVGGNHSIFLIQISPMLGKGDGNSTGKRYVRLIGDQALISLANGEERRGTSGLQCKAGPSEIQLERESGCEEVVAVSHQVWV